MLRCLKIIIQFLLIAGILGFLFWNAAAATDEDGKNVFTLLCEQPKRWHLLAGAFFAQLFGTAVTFIRWRWLVRALGLQCSHRDAFRWGFLGVMLNLAPFGIVGGDAVKAVLIAQKNPDYKSQAVASVFIDRFIGLIVMFICGTLLICWTGFLYRDEIIAETLTHIVIVCTISGLLGTCIVFLPFFPHGYIERLIEKLPLIGHLLSQLVNALLLYRYHKRCLLFSAMITFLVHISFGTSLYCAAAGLFPSVPGLEYHIMLHNVTNVTSMIPLAAGPYELVLEQLYQLSGQNIGMGLVVALMYRLAAVGVALTGITYYYLSSAGCVRDFR